MISNFDVILNSLNEQKDEKGFIKVKSGTRTYILNFDEIINIQTTSVNGKLRVSTMNSQIEFYGTIKGVLKKLDERFCMSHRSCIVNKNHISMVNREKYNFHIIMVNGEKSLLSKNYVKEVVGKDE